MFIPSNEELTRKLSPRTARIFGVIGLILSVSILALSVFSGDKIAIAFSAIFCTLLGIFSVSLLYGNGSKGKGILTPTLLYILGAVMIVADVLVSIVSSSIPYAGVLLGLGCFALAKKRKSGSIS
ncbi:hypothetical protein [Aliiglaciecola litoralis]|uniref:hypothetical protein n=1 Tax=Aliiglaciecola litoralis TaxID=582857 RepID=UPI0031DFFFE8